jgi:hypothetical protein
MELLASAFKIDKCEQVEVITLRHITDQAESAYDSRHNNKRMDHQHADMVMAWLFCALGCVRSCEVGEGVG